MNFSGLYIFGYLVFSCFLGTFFVTNFLTKKALQVYEKVIFGSLLGITVVSLITYFFSLFLPFFEVSRTIGLIGIGIFGYLIYRISCKKVLLKRFKLTGLPLILLITSIVWGVIFFVLLNKTHLNYKEGTYYGSPSTYGDLPFHLSVITNFSYGHNFPPVNPIYPENNLSYHFLADFISSIFLVLGAQINLVIIIPSMIFGIFLTVIISIFTYRISKSNLASIISPAIFLFNGGLGFVKLFENISNMGLVNGISFHDRYAHLSYLGIEYPNILGETLMAQRATLLGLPLSLSFVFFIYKWLVNKNIKYLIVSGIIFGLLPYSNIYGCLSVGLLLIIVLIFESIKKRKINWPHYLVFGVTFIIISFPFFIRIGEQIASHNSFIRLSLFEWPPLDSKEKLLAFWLTNFGVTPFLAILALVLVKNISIVGKQLLFIWTFLIILSHFIIFQPYAWDNNHFVLYSFIAISILSAILISKIIKKGGLFMFLGSVILLLAVFNGVLVAYHDPQIQYGLYTDSDFKLASYVITNTNPNGIFLTASSHNHPIPSLAGRKILLGYGGYLWTQGITDTSQKEIMIKSIFEGKNDSVRLAKDLGIKYIIIGHWEKEQYSNINEDYFLNSYRLIYNQEEVKIFEVI